MSPLLDTQVLAWWFENHPRLSSAQRDILESAEPSHPLWICDISLWEIATLCSKGRLKLTYPLWEWLDRATGPPLMRRIGLTPASAAEIAQLPDLFHRDPADRILIATARVMGFTLLTQDSKILDSELVPTIP